MSKTPEMSSMAKEFPIIRSALRSSPFPLAMEQSGAPPMPNRLANAMTSVMIGSESPMPVKDRVA